MGLNLVRASMVVMSHLSDIQYLTSIESNNINEIDNRLNFAKYVILETNGNLNADINANAMWLKFTESQFYKA